MDGAGRRTARQEAGRPREKQPARAMDGPAGVKWRGQDSNNPVFSRGKPAVANSSGAYSGALPANLKHVIDNWGLLTEDDRRRIRAIVDGRLA